MQRYIAHYTKYMYTYRVFLKSLTVCAAFWCMQCDPTTAHCLILNIFCMDVDFIYYSRYSMLVEKRSSVVMATMITCKMHTMNDCNRGWPQSMNSFLNTVYLSWYTSCITMMCLLLYLYIFIFPTSNDSVIGFASIYVCVCVWVCICMQWTYLNIRFQWK